MAEKKSFGFSPFLAVAFFLRFYNIWWTKRQWIIKYKLPTRKYTPRTLALYTPSEWVCMIWCVHIKHFICVRMNIDRWITTEDVTDSYGLLEWPMISTTHACIHLHLNIFHTRKKQRKTKWIKIKINTDKWAFWQLTWQRRMLTMFMQQIILFTHKFIIIYYI